MAVPIWELAVGRRALRAPEFTFSAGLRARLLFRNQAFQGSVLRFCTFKGLASQFASALKPLRMVPPNAIWRFKRCRCTAMARRSCEPTSPKRPLKTAHSTAQVYGNRERRGC